MPDPHMLLAFTLATALLMLVPGPNVALIVANSLAHGARFGLLTVAGTVAGVAPQLLLVCLGLAGVLDLAGHGLAWLRWAGAAYLVVLGIRAWRANEPDLGAVAPQARSPRAIFLRAVLIALSNPKTLLFLGAFLPQFTTTAAPATPQVALLSVDLYQRRHPDRFRMGAARRTPARLDSNPRPSARAPHRRPADRRRGRAGARARKMTPFSDR